MIDTLYTYDDIAKKAEELLLNSGFAGCYPVPVDKIAVYLGFTAYAFDPNQKTSGISGLVDHEQRSIFVNSKESLERKRFTLAHEIGHIILHGANENHIDYRAVSAKNPKETEADHFAGCLLMPESVFQRQWDLLDADIDALVSFFGVSRSAVKVRAHRLNLF